MKERYIYHCQGSHMMVAAYPYDTLPPVTMPDLNETRDGVLITDKDPLELGWKVVHVRRGQYGENVELDWYCPECNPPKFTKNSAAAVE